MRFAGWTLSALLVAGAAFAQQGPPQGPRGNGKPGLEALKTYLNLSDAQITNLTAVRTSLRDAIQPMLQDLAAKRQALRAENLKTTPDPNVVAQLKQDISNLLGQIQAQRGTSQKQALTYLTADQLALLDKLNQALQLMPAARAAAAFDLITPPEGIGTMRSPGGRAGMGPMMRRRPTR